MRGTGECIPRAAAGEQAGVVAHEGVELGASEYWWCDKCCQADHILQSGMYTVCCAEVRRHTCCACKLCTSMADGGATK